MHTYKKPGFARLLALAAVLTLVAAACGDDADAPDTTAAPAPQTTAAATPDTPDTTQTMEPMEPLRIAIVAPSASNDLAFTQSIVDAVNVIVAEHPGTEVAITDGTFIVDDAAAAIRGYAQDGYDLVIAHGSQYGGPLEEIAADFPDTAFAWGTSSDTFGLSNVSAYTAASDQGGYVMGVIAAGLSNSGVIGVVGPIEVGDAKLYVDGFHNGAVASGDVTVNINYIGSFSDVALASEAAQAHVASGADVLTGSAQMVVGAVGVAQANGALWFGTQANQTDLAPSQVVASQVYKWEVVLRQILADHSAGTLGGKSYEINLANGGLVIEYNDGFSLPADLRAAADNAAAGIISGAVNTMDAMPMEPLRIAIVAPSASNDLAFTQSIVDAVNVIVAEHPGTEVAITDGTFIVDDAAAAIRGYAQDGYDLVIAHGSQYGGPLEEIAADFPDTAFAWGTSSDTFGLSNVSAYTAASDQGGYVMGVIAAGLSNSGVIGVVGPIEVGDAKLYVDGFHNGAVASGDVTVNINYIGSFSDVALASEAAQAHVASGADVLTGSAQMVVGAVGVAQANGALWFGTQANQTDLAPSQVVASQVYKWEVVLRQILADHSAGTLGGKSYEINLANGGLVIEYNDGFSLPADLRAAADNAAAGIIDGSVSTGAS